MNRIYNINALSTQSLSCNTLPSLEIVMPSVLHAWNIIHSLFQQKQFKTLVLAFRTDHFTLVRRLEVQVHTVSLIQQ